MTKGTTMATATQDWSALASGLQRALGTDIPAMAITFHAQPPVGVAAFEEPMPAPTEDGRTGRVPAGCVFWMHGTERTFSTVAEDHGNCSVGSLTHGFKTLDEVASNADVAALLESGWVSMEVVPQIPVVSERPAAVSYGPLAETGFDPDVVFLRITGRQLMVLMDAFPDLPVEGKPQCHIVAMAKQGTMAASAGCQLSRVRTGMPNSEMTLAIPAAQLPGVIGQLEQTAATDNVVARYAAEDARRFGP
jgi:uncharacterized protein (DUF169 family)